MLEQPGKASEWLISLAEAPGDAALQARFRAWLAADPSHERDWLEIDRTYRALGRLAPPVAKPRRRHRPLAVAAAALAACLALAVFLPGSGTTTGTAERRTLALPDGSIVQLAPRSAITIAYDQSARRVRLTRGEAFFQVAHDTERPFTVESGAARTTDIGTAFDIRVGEGATEIAVQEGLVEVAVNAQSERLAAGDSLHVTESGVRRAASRPDDVIAWTRGQFVAKNRPVAEVVDALRPYFHGVILVRGTSLDHRPLTGVYNLDDPIGALRAIARAEGADIVTMSPWLLVISGS